MRPLVRPQAVQPWVSSVLSRGYHTKERDRWLSQRKKQGTVEPWLSHGRGGADIYVPLPTSPILEGTSDNRDRINHDYNNHTML